MIKRILLGITGGIAAYKSVFLARELSKRGHSVQVILTPAATQFASKQTLQAITNSPVYTELFTPKENTSLEHISLPRWADLLLVAPATANTLAKFSHGIADNLLTTIYLASDIPIILAPAMNQQMWRNPATQQNISILADRPNHYILPAVSGIQACGENGPGRMTEVEDIIAAIDKLWAQDLTGLSLAITAGPTQESIDPVRYLSNHSSGKMGYALAQAACYRGASVTLISGPTTLIPPKNCTVIPVTSALEMYNAALSIAPHMDIFISAAAVSDYRIAEISPHKLKKTIHGPLQITLVENPDIVATIAALPSDQRPFTVGFAAETNNLLEYARAKRKDKNLDMIIANDVSSDVFGSDSNQVVLMDAHSEIILEKNLKSRIADVILSQILTRIKS